MRPTIYFASDHAGFMLKNELMGFVRDTLGYVVIDCGAESLHELDDYTDFISKAARAVSESPEDSRAIIIGGSGQGEAMLANRFDNVRAALYYGGPQDILRLSRQHNDANILSLGARFVGGSAARDAVALWLATEHVPIEKYDRRIQKAEAESEQSRLASDTLVRSIAPSLPPRNFSELQQLANSLEGVSPALQVDIVDGVFAPYVSWPFTQLHVEEELEQLKQLTTTFEIEIDCMCMHPETYLDLLSQLHVARVIIHVGSTKAYDKAIQHAQDHGYRLGLAITNDSGMDILKRYGTRVDFVQVMGIEHVGIQGQPFDERTIHTVAQIRREYPKLEIAVDGGVNAQTIGALLRAGANRFAPGSAIDRSSDPAISYKQLAELIGL